MLKWFERTKEGAVQLNSPVHNSVPTPKGQVLESVQSLAPGNPDSEEKVPVTGTNRSISVGQLPGITHDGKGLQGNFPAQWQIGDTKLYDPYNGLPIGSLEIPPEERESKLSETHEKLWLYLGQLRQLQHEMAQLHMKMEGFSGTDRTSGTFESLGKTALNDDEDTEDTKFDEFDHLDDVFKRKQGMMDHIMQKLDELSKVVGEFNMIPNVQPPLVRPNGASSSFLP